MFEDINLVLFRGYGTPQRLVFSGRALRDAPDVGVAGASTLQNLVASFDRIDSQEVANVTVRAVYRGEEWETTSDDEGYFVFVLEPASPPDPVQVWQEVTVRWVDAAGDRSGPPVTAYVLTPLPTSTFGVISDIDDTVLASHITSVVKMALEMLLKNAHSRATFAGVPEFYCALQRGADGQANNPIFYVSLSPWNLYALIDQFMAINNIPAGPVLLRDYGLQMLAGLRRPSAKHALIQEVLDAYPRLPFILLGDSGQHDPEIYAATVRDNPDRILAVYIRDVSEGRDLARRAEIETLAAELADTGVDMLLSHQTADFAAHAAGKGLIGCERPADS
jgi:phosphatidate phosphatase APP1